MYHRSAEKQTSLQAMEQLEQITVTMAIAKLWRAVGIAHKLLNDSEIAAFLLQHYEKTELGIHSEDYHCMNCNQPLSLYLCTGCAADTRTSKESHIVTRRKSRRPTHLSMAELTGGAQGKVTKAKIEKTKAEPGEQVEEKQKVAAKTELKQKSVSGDSDPFSSGEDETSELPVQFEQTESEEYVPSLTDLNDADLTDSDTSFPPAATKKRKLVRKAKDKTRTKYECKHCSASFKEAYRLKRHCKIHAEDYGKDRLYSCKECRMTFRLKGSLDAHMRKHSGQQPYLCAICNVAFTRAKQSKQHVQAVHPKLLNMSACFKCAQCLAEFVLYKKFTTHVWRHTLERKFKCDHCPMAFFEQSNLRVHMRVHTGYKPYTCSECGQSFHQLCNLNRHILTHSGERPYICTLCPATYPASQQLKQHLQSHRGEKPFLCQLCGASYTESKSLKYHFRSHTGEKPYKCDTCEKEFARPSSLKVHKRTHSCDRPYVCAICGVSFADNSNLHRHDRLKHSGKAKKRQSGRKVITDSNSGVERINVSLDPVSKHCSRDFPRVQQTHLKIVASVPQISGVYYVT